MTRQSILKSLLFVAALFLWGAVHANTVTYVYTDPQGTPLAEADANGNITATFDYRPYGTQALGTTPNGPGYTGHVNDPETDLVYMQARYYDPSVGKFLSIDPVTPTVGNAFNFNRYAYVSNNPIMHTDPSGKCLEDLCIGEGILVYEGVEALVAIFEVSETAAAVTETAVAATEVTATSTTASTVISQAASQCGANATCTGLALTAVTAVTAKAVQAIEQTPITQSAEEHTSNARPSTKGKHEKGNSRRKTDAGNEKGDQDGKRRHPRQRPPGRQGPWPPKPFTEDPS